MLSVCVTASFTVGVGKSLSILLVSSAMIMSMMTIMSTSFQSPFSICFNQGGGFLKFVHNLFSMEKQYNLCALIGFALVLVSAASQALIIASHFMGKGLGEMFHLTGPSGLMILGLFYMMGGLLRLVGLILAIVALFQISKSHQKGKELAWITIVLVIALWIVPFLLLIFGANL